MSNLFTSETLDYWVYTHLLYQVIRSIISSKLKAQRGVSGSNRENTLFG